MVTPAHYFQPSPTPESWGGHREAEVYEKFRSLSPFEVEGSLQWLGGTYAAYPQFYPREQSEIDWITQKLFPLGTAAHDYLDTVPVATHAQDAQDGRCLLGS